MCFCASFPILKLLLCFPASILYLLLCPSNCPYACHCDGVSINMSAYFSQPHSGPVTGRRSKSSTVSVSVYIAFRNSTSSPVLRSRPSNEHYLLNHLPLQNFRISQYAHSVAHYGRGELCDLLAIKFCSFVHKSRCKEDPYFKNKILHWLK